MYYYYLIYNYPFFMKNPIKFISNHFDSKVIRKEYTGILQVVTSVSNSYYFASIEP